MLQAAIFDMDGLLIDSEPLWRRAEQRIFAPLGVALTDAMCMQTMGLRVDEVVRHWHRLHPWAEPSREEVAHRIVDAVVELVEREGAPLDGVGPTLDLCARRGLRLALASSSSRRLIDAVIGRLGLAGRFEVIHSAESEPYGKPHPGVFLTAARCLGVDPTACLVLEDSFAGVIAGLAARMKVVAVPAPADFAQARFDVAHAKLRSLRDLDEARLERLAGR
ncbi:MAG: hexitol phosphatase HxpB [Gemmatimonadota bacterium]